MVRSILITSMGTATSVSLMKAIKHVRPDIKIVGTDITPIGLTAGSMLVDSFYQVPYAVDEKYIPEIVKIIKQETVDAVIPINDIEIRIIAENMQHFSFVLKRLPAINVLDTACNKLTCTKLLEKSGQLCPKIFSDDYVVGSRIQRECISVGSKGIYFLKDGEKKRLIDSDSFIQEVISGDEYTIDILSDVEGKPLYIVPRQRIEVKSGVATKVKIIYDEQMIEACKKILKLLPIPGFSNIQFIKDSDDQNYFIEMNPRFGGFTISSVMASDWNIVAEFIKSLENNDSNNSLEENLNKIKWGSIITRYYEEKLFIGD